MTTYTTDDDGLLDTEKAERLAGAGGFVVAGSVYRTEESFYYLHRNLIANSTTVRRITKRRATDLTRALKRRGGLAVRDP